MGRYTMLKKEFDFLTRVYRFKISMKQKHGAYYYIEWTNPNKSIMVLYDEQVEIPLTIRIYDADSFGLDSVEYKKEFAQNGTPQEKIHSAGEWLRNAIENNELLDFDAAEYQYQNECVQNRRCQKKIHSIAKWLRKTIPAKICMFLRLN